MHAAHACDVHVIAHSLDLGLLLIGFPGNHEMPEARFCLLLRQLL